MKLTVSIVLFLYLFEKKDSNLNFGTKRREEGYYNFFWYEGARIHFRNYESTYLSFHHHRVQACNATFGFSAKFLIRKNQIRQSHRLRLESLRETFDAENKKLIFLNFFKLRNVLEKFTTSNIKYLT